MCPNCVASLALIAAGAGSAGGLSAALVAKWRAHIGAKATKTRAAAQGKK